MRFTGKVALVTGGAGGIGQATVRALVEGGARVGVLDNNKDALDEVAAQCSSDTALVVAADVRELTEVQAAVAAVEKRFGPIQLLHNHAGIFPQQEGSILDVTAETFAATLSINVVGQFNVAQTVSRRMVQSGGGVIVNTASDLSFIALAGACSYVTSKSAILGLTRSMATDLAPHGVRVNAVCPGFISTNMTAELERDPAAMVKMRAAYLMPELGRPEDVAGVVAFLLSDEARFMTGSMVLVDGGHIVT